MDTVMLTVDERTALLAAYLVNYGFVRELVRRDYTIVRCLVEACWDLALCGVTLTRGGRMNAGWPTAVQALKKRATRTPGWTSPTATVPRSPACI